MSNFLHCAKRFADMHLSAVCDTIDHCILVSHHNTSFGFIHTVYSWLQSYLIGRYQSVHVDRHSFTPTVSTFRVPRGSVLGPCSFLYTSLVSDIVSSFNVQHRQYADDTNTMQIFISLSSTYQISVSLTHSLTHCLSTHDSVLIAWF